MSIVLESPNNSSTTTATSASADLNSPSVNDREVLPRPLTSAVNGVSGAGPSSCDDPSRERLSRQLSTASFQDLDEEDAAQSPTAAHGEDFVLGPLLPLKQQLDKDNDDESLRRWKQQLLGSIHLDGVPDIAHPEVNMQSLSILSPGRQDIVIDLPITSSYKTHLFTLKEGSIYRLKFTFSVHHNLVSGLTYIHTVWKNGIRVDNTRVMLGTYAPQREPYVVILDEETTPSGYLARGSYTAKTKFVDDDKRCHFEIEHRFDICKEW
ncbi:hypothetical protein KP509_31G032800 [Ceratopteris richardii]|nr:hypothetical protein KP509_31G032800 [Ceratopteris richardii]